MIKLNYSILDDRGFPPERMHPGDAGFDLRCIEDLSIPSGERRAVATGIAVAVPEGHCGLVMPRSGLALKLGVTVVNAPGLIDSGYRGEIRVLLINHGDDRASFRAGERIAQLVVCPLSDLVVEEVEDLDATVRGGGGFGSTGR